MLRSSVMICVLVYWFFCALLWLLPMGILPLPVRACVRPWCSPVCAKLSAKVRKTGIIRLRKRYFFCGSCHFSLCESAKILYKKLKPTLPKRPTSRAELPDKARRVARQPLPSLSTRHTILAGKPQDFCRKIMPF